MMDIGWSELLLIGVVALIVIGPKELPGLFREIGRFTGKARVMAREFQRSLEQAADETGLNEATKGLKSLNQLNLKTPTATARKYATDVARQAVDPEASTPATTPPPAAGPAPAAAAPAPAAAAAPKPDAASGDGRQPAEESGAPKP